MPFQPDFHLHLFFFNRHHLHWLLLFPFLVCWVGLIFVVAVNTTCTTIIKINLFLLRLRFVLKKHSLGGAFYSPHSIGQALLKHAGHEAVLIECLGAQAYQDNLFTQLSPWFFYFSKGCWEAGWKPDELTGTIVSSFHLSSRVSGDEHRGDKALKS